MEMIRQAVISDCQKYRYVLYREWAEPDDPFGVLVLNFVMLNPSKADGTIDDPTVRKCIGFAKLLGYNAIRVVNLFSWRATEPKELRKAYIDMLDVVGPDNDSYVRELPKEETIVVAWGSTFQKERFIQYRIRDTIKLLNRKLWCLGKTKNGHPRHPVMLGYGPLIEF